jgi:2'-5' RNA ligase
MAETAIAVLFPELEPLVGELRSLHTRSGARDMPPHVTLIYPFADSSEVDGLIPVVRRELGRFAPFEVTFRRLGRFPGHVYLVPEPEEPFVEMTAALEQAFPSFPPYGGKFDEVVPHLGIADGDEKVLEAIERELLPALNVTSRVECVWLLEDTPEGWRRHTGFPLDRH